MAVLCTGSPALLKLQRLDELLVGLRRRGLAQNLRTVGRLQEGAVARLHAVQLLRRWRALHLLQQLHVGERVARGRDQLRLRHLLLLLAGRDGVRLLVKLLGHDGLTLARVRQAMLLLIGGVSLHLLAALQVSYPLRQLAMLHGGKLLQFWSLIHVLPAHFLRDELIQMLLRHVQRLLHEARHLWVLCVSELRLAGCGRSLVAHLLLLLVLDAL